MRSKARLAGLGVAAALAVWLVAAQPARAGSARVCRSLHVDRFPIHEQFTARADLLLNVCSWTKPIPKGRYLWKVTGPQGAVVPHGVKSPILVFKPSEIGVYTISLTVSGRRKSEKATEQIRVELTYHSCTAPAHGTCGFVSNVSGVMVTTKGGRGTVTVVDTTTHLSHAFVAVGTVGPAPTTPNHRTKLVNNTTGPATMSEVKPKPKGSSSSAPTASALHGCVTVSNQNPPFRIVVHVIDSAARGASGKVTVSGAAGTTSETVRVDSLGFAVAPFTIDLAGTVAITIAVDPLKGTPQTIPLSVVLYAGMATTLATCTPVGG
jgi:hypothetical protein